jgi:D-serine deaminase-like pyridoxal phosphate-dependent protein
METASMNAIDLVSSVQIDALATPCLVLDEAKMTRNIARLQARLAGLGVPLRPHLKTSKSIDVARRVMPTAAGPITVSTLLEAEQFAECGVTDILYAVGIAPSKLQRAQNLRDRGVDLTVVVDGIDQAEAVAAFSRDRGVAMPVLIEIDCDGHRSGVRPESELLTQIALALGAGAELRGVFTHAGGSYDRPGPLAIVAAADQERDAVLLASERLRQAGFAAPIVGVGSTPTAHFCSSLSGVTEVRAGVFVFFDLVMAGLGVCTIDDIALSTLATVIGHQDERNWIITDAGWMAMSRDRGTARQSIDQGYGLVCDIAGRPYPDLILSEANQEHSIARLRPGANGRLPHLPVGTIVRILPNHACATAAQHSKYHVLGSDGTTIKAIWPRFAGW